MNPSCCKGVDFGISHYRPLSNDRAACKAHGGLKSQHLRSGTDMPHISLVRLCLLFLATTCIFFFGLGQAQLWDRDEPRNSRAAVEMLERGDWIVPTFNGELRAHKPILLYWGQMTSFLALGRSEFAARLPSALAALAAVWSVAVLASRLSGHPRGISSGGFWSAAVLATSLLMVMAGRAATPDALLIATSTLGVSALVVGALAPSAPFSSGSVGNARWLHATLAYLFFGLAVLAKGPVGIVLPLAVVHLWWMIQFHLMHNSHSSTATLRHWTVQLLIEAWGCLNPLNCLRAILALRTIPGLIVASVVAVPWYYAVGLATDGAFLRGFFLEHNLGRAIQPMEGHDGNALFYPIALIVGIFPWSLWLIPMVIWTRSAYRENAVQRQMICLGLVWVAVYLIAFSIASTKLPSYITPCLAGASLLVGSFWKQFESAWQMPRIGWRVAANSLSIAIGIAITVAVCTLASIEQMPGLLFASAAGLAIVIAGLAGLVCERLQRAQWIPIVWLSAAVVFQISLFGIGAGQASQYRQDVELITSSQRVQPSKNWFGVGPVEPSWVYYLGQTIVDVDAGTQPGQVWEKVDDLLGEQPHGRLVVVGESVEELQRERSRHPNLSRLVELGRCQRFLKSGELVLYGLNEPAEALKMASPLDPTDTRR